MVSHFCPPQSRVKIVAPTTRLFYYVLVFSAGDSDEANAVWDNVVHILAATTMQHPAGEAKDNNTKAENTAYPSLDELRELLEKRLAASKDESSSATKQLEQIKALHRKDVLDLKASLPPLLLQP